MIPDLHDELVRSGTFAPLALGTAEEARWADWDLASLAENRLEDRTDPRGLDEARRADWRARATLDVPWTPSARSEYEQCYWIVEDGEQIGTLAIAAGGFRQARVDVSSFYVLPCHRGRGVGRRALGRVQQALARRKLGLRLDTCWCWPKAVRFYLGIGMWIYMWKRDLTFCWDPATPRPLIDVGDDTASLSVPVGSRSVELARARRRGDALELDEPPRALQKEERIGGAYWHAVSTLSLAIALRGFPLVRSEEHWKKGYWADAGPPEALAYKITLWEAWYREHGWLVRTSRIPGLAYPTWTELEARWAEEAKSVGLGSPEGA